MINFTLKPNHFHITDNVFFQISSVIGIQDPPHASSEAASTQSLCCNGFIDLKICSKQIIERREERMNEGRNGEEE